ncbi:MAG: MBL fold metallo-hydrolase [Pelagibacteraceae bacterium]|jgi:N-acyl-phosphatidylethanolamine-hydrolysing phospholipase D|nr:MBL fold metallo-hydrolase [Pseudomonadota bacterium]
MKKIKSKSRRSFIQNTAGLALATSILPAFDLYAARPYHHLADGTFRNVEGSPQRNSKGKFSYITFNKEKKKIIINIPKDHIIAEQEVLQKIKQLENTDYIGWIGHATFLIKLGSTTILTDPLFSKNAGPLNFGPKRYVDPAIALKKLPKIDLLLQTHNHYDHLDLTTIKKFPHKTAVALTPLKVGSYFTKRKFTKVQELDWYQKVTINDITLTFLPAVHWSKRSLTDRNKTLWGSYLIEYKGKKLFFSCDTGYGNIYKTLGNQIGPVDLLFINIGAYDFRPMFDKSIFHATPEEALQIGKDLKAKKVIGMHWGTIMLSLEDPFEPPVRFTNAAKKFGYSKKEAVIFKIGEIKKLTSLI